MSIPQRSIASVYAVHTAGALSVWSPVNFRDGSRAKAVLTTPRNTPSELCARSTRACLLSSGDCFQSMRIGGDGSPYPPLQLIATETCASLSHLFTLVGRVERRPFSTCWQPGRF